MTRSSRTSIISLLALVENVLLLAHVNSNTFVIGSDVRIILILTRLGSTIPKGKKQWNYKTSIKPQLRRAIWGHLEQEKIYETHLKRCQWCSIMVINYLKCAPLYSVYQMSKGREIATIFEDISIPNWFVKKLTCGFKGTNNIPQNLPV